MSYGVIYTIENKVNGKIYVGQTTKNFNERYGGDIEKNTHNKHLQNSIKKYGIENFVIDKYVCECDSEEELNEAEKFYIDFFDSANSEHGYNKTLGGEGMIPNEETKEKISKTLKGKYCGEKHPKYGKRLSEETKQKISKALSGEKHPMCGKRHSEETKKKMSEANSGENNGMWGKNPEDYMTTEAIKIKREKQSEVRKGKYCGEKHPRAKSIVQLDKNGNFIKKYNFINEAAKELNIAGQHISACCRGKIKSSGGFKFMYEEDYIDLIKYSF